MLPFFALDHTWLIHVLEGWIYTLLFFLSISFLRMEILTFPSFGFPSTPVAPGFPSLELELSENLVLEVSQPRSKHVTIYKKSQILGEAEVGRGRGRQR